MAAISSGFVRPWHRFVSRMCSRVQFSVGELLIVVGILGALAFLAVTVVLLCCRPDKLRRLYRFLLTCLTAFALIYGGFCLLWGPYYYSADFEEQSGIFGEPIGVEQLTVLTRYFTDLVNKFDREIPRDADGSFAVDARYAIEHSAALYDGVSELVPCLQGDALQSKPFFFSRFLSYINFTGFFFPFTGEANINVDSPAALIPSTVAHEIAHQRGVAEEDEADFVAVLSSLESDDPVFAYSACLMAYIHLGNALYKADRDAWSENYQRLADGPRQDLSENNAYWAQFETPVSTVADSVYNGFLQSYGQELGVKTYGKCVDLLVAYYYEAALAAIETE